VVPPVGESRVPVMKQLLSVLSELQTKPLKEYFEDDNEKHVCYIAGFLCHAGQLEGGRRTGKNKVGECIAAVSDRRHPFNIAKGHH
jgi:hypothetical protein